MASKGIHLCQPPLLRVHARSHMQVMQHLTQTMYSACKNAFADMAHKGTHANALAKRRCSHRTFASSLGLEVLDGSPPPILLGVGHQPNLGHRDALLLQSTAETGSAADTALFAGRRSCCSTAGGPSCASRDFMMIPLQHCAGRGGTAQSIGTAEQHSELAVSYAL